jgi:tetratricopeptide (TPR) repeat protein
MKSDINKSTCKNPASFHVRLLFFSCLLSTIYCLLLSGCAFPRIIILDDPLTPEEHLNLGVTYEKDGEFDNALKEYHAASEKLPLAYLYIGNIYFQKADLDETESYYKKAVKKDPENADAYNNLAWLYYTKGENLDEAERLALRAIELNPSKRVIYEDTLKNIRDLKAPPYIK